LANNDDSSQDIDIDYIIKFGLLSKKLIRAYSLKILWNKLSRQLGEDRYININIGDD